MHEDLAREQGSRDGVQAPSPHSLLVVSNIAPDTLVARTGESGFEGEYVQRPLVHWQQGRVPAGVENSDILGQIPATDARIGMDGGKSLSPMAYHDRICASVAI
jgi:hypothetical protein